MDHHPFVSIIIVNFNGKRWLKECLASLDRLNYPKDRVEIILGDNASTDDSVEWTRENFPEVRILRFEKNFGFCKTNNLCAEQARGEYLIFLNNDTYVSYDWVTQLVQGVHLEKGVVICTSKILFPHLANGKVLNSAGGVFISWGGGTDEGWMEEDSLKFNVQKYTGFGCGAGILVEKDFFLRTGGFDEYYIYSVEDIDLAFRAWMQGYKVLYVPLAVMYHYSGGTRSGHKGVRPINVFLISRNSLYFILKNFEGINATKGLFLSLLKTLYLLVYFLPRGNAAAFLAHLKGYVYFMKDLSKILEARKAAQKQRKIKDETLRKRGILISIFQLFRRACVIKNSMRKMLVSDYIRYEVEDQFRLKFDKNGDVYFEEITKS